MRVGMSCIIPRRQCSQSISEDEVVTEGEAAKHLAKSFVPWDFSVFCPYAFCLSEFSTNCLKNGERFQHESFSFMRMK